MNEFKRYNFERAQEEAEKLRQKIESGEASEYDEAEKLVELEQKENKENEIDVKKGEEYKYSLEANREAIKIKAEKIRDWAQEVGLIEGKDFKIIESITDAGTDTNSIAPHEKKQFFVIMQEDHYRKFKEYITGRYTEERKKENPTNTGVDPTLDYSWGGRFAIINDEGFCDTAAASSIEYMTAPTHHEEFRSFFKQQAGFDFPTSETLNPMLQEMSEKGLDIYREALEKLKALKKQETLPGDGYGLIDAMKHMVMILEDAKTGEAVIDLSEVIVGVMPAKMRHYADVTYNAEDVKDLGRVTEITGITIPDEVRIDKIFDRYGFEREKMEDICRDFSEYILIKQELEKKNTSP
jgi:hypothetical protein